MSTAGTSNTAQRARLLLALSYTGLVCAFVWAGRQTDGEVAVWVFLGCLAFSWLPAYVYVHRREISREKPFWISHAAAGIVGLVLFGIHAAMDEPPGSLPAGRSWPQIFSSLAAYVVGGVLSIDLARWVMKKIQDRSESWLKDRLR